mmetsp:Transcript_36156/g.81402  ORF Transcript_36156/g.81402 Transcript_36156/m.81402 type:complete len:263 (+) Transcript_36156:352-1140(+)
MSSHFPAETGCQDPILLPCFHWRFPITSKSRNTASAPTMNFCPSNSVFQASPQPFHLRVLRIVSDAGPPTIASIASLAWRISASAKATRELSSSSGSFSPDHKSLEATQQGSNPLFPASTDVLKGESCGINPLDTAFGPALINRSNVFFFMAAFAICIRARTMRCWDISVLNGVPRLFLSSLTSLAYKALIFSWLSLNAISFCIFLTRDTMTAFSAAVTRLSSRESLNDVPLPGCLLGLMGICRNACELEGTSVTVDALFSC